MDDETIAIQIELKNFAQAMSQLRQVAQAVRAIPGSAGGGGRGGGGGGSRGGGSIGGAGASMQQKVMGMFMRSRVGIGGGAGMQMMPLARDLAAIFGPEAAIAAVIGTQMVQAVTNAASALSDMAKQAAGAGLEFARMQMLSGGTGGQTAYLKSFDSLIGGNTNALANALAHELSAGGYATAIGARYGIRDVGFAGNPNRADNMERMIDAVRKMSDAEYQQAAYVSDVVRALGPNRLLSDQRIMRQSVTSHFITGPIHDKQFQENSAEFTAALGGISQAFNNFMTATIKPFLPSIIRFLDMLTDGINGVALMIDAHQGQIQGFLEMLEGLFTGHMDLAAKGFKELTTNTVVQNHTRAMERHTDALEASVREGTFGGGERARGAIPGKWNGINTKYYIGSSAALGAFNL